MNVREEHTKTEFSRISSSMGDVILQRDSVARTGEIVHRETVMYVPVELPKGENLCTLS